MSSLPLPIQTYITLNIHNSVTITFAVFRVCSTEVHGVCVEGTNHEDHKELLHVEGNSADDCLSGQPYLEFMAIFLIVDLS